MQVIRLGRAEHCFVARHLRHRADQFIRHRSRAEPLEVAVDGLDGGVLELAQRPRSIRHARVRRQVMRRRDEQDHVEGGGSRQHHREPERAKQAAIARGVKFGDVNGESNDVWCQGVSDECTGSEDSSLEVPHTSCPGLLDVVGSRSETSTGTVVDLQ